LDRFGAGVRAAPRDALIAGSVAAPYRGRAFGLEGLGDNAGACLGPLIALLLLSIGALQLRTIIYLAVIPGLGAFLMVLLVRERTEPGLNAPAHWPRLSRLPPAYWRYLAATAIFGVGNSSNAFLILRTRETGASLYATILVYAAFNLVAALISYPAGAFSDRRGRGGLLLGAFAVFALAYVGFAVTGRFAVVAVLFVFYGLYQGIFRAVGKSLAADLVPANMRATGIGCYNATNGMLQLMASVVAGLLWDHASHAAVFWFGGFWACCGGIAFLVCMRPALHGAASPPA
jgi:MFS family permease